MLLIAFIAEPTVAKRILDHLRLTRPGRRWRRRESASPTTDPAPAHDVADPVYEG